MMSSLSVSHLLLLVNKAQKVNHYHLSGCKVKSFLLLLFQFNRLILHFHKKTLVKARKGISKDAFCTSLPTFIKESCDTARFRIHSRESVNLQPKHQKMTTRLKTRLFRLLPVSNGSPPFSRGRGRRSRSVNRQTKEKSCSS